MESQFQIVRWLEDKYYGIDKCLIQLKKHLTPKKQHEIAINPLNWLPPSKSELHKLNSCQ